jgi:hypothetical protein
MPDDKKGTDYDLAMEWRARAKEWEWVARRAVLLWDMEQSKGCPEPIREETYVRHLQGEYQNVA